ncbi:indole-3-glycerol-phosphate synthase [Xanthobacter dioxanivorans]|uniref:indole-3-glycerol-phosphate synthase n=1 Tax=Xanthobacter dioxanivorans TaxID=2528964 RepID=A0A974SH64_9HYPH|nr:indole-3-glycerol-phosphate synthase [Xanthobacter dioxanivorans]QRG05395.1 indole-3-glycerol-phosphate synthase [Xanthobacter dioxanivorans]
MPLPAGSRLKPFIVQRLDQLNKAKARRSLGQIQGKIGEMPMTRGFQGALAAAFNRTGVPSIIAELKGGSPFDPALRTMVPYKALAEDFEAVGAAGLSVAVERQVFRGSYSDLATVRGVVDLPLLARDIIFDVYQILEARLAGADAVVLSAGLLGAQLGEFRERAASIALDVLVEVHTPAEVEAARAAGADFLCVTNRNIHTFELKPGTCEELLPLIPAGAAFVVADGGLGSAEDRARLGTAGAKALLIGTALMTDADPAGVLEQVMGVETTGAEADAEEG